ncbi:MAG: hypothetical protein IPJ65_21615 [Archangiaceae bacterium]|nr:hypothetical protein [Archangiaceae bacterium]
MRRVRLLALLLLTGCFDFGRALSDCYASGRCPDGGATGGGTSGGSTAGGQGGMSGGTATAGGGATAGGAGGGSAVTFTRATCTDGGVCWDHPLPHGRDFGAVYAAGPDDVWGAGRAGLLTHWNGAGFTEVDPLSIAGSGGLPFADLWLVWGLASDDVWATGSRHPLLHFDGGSWSGVSVGGSAPANNRSCFGIDGTAQATWVSCDGRLYRGSAAGVAEVKVDAGLDCGVLLADPGGAGVTCAPRAGAGAPIVHVLADAGWVTASIAAPPQLVTVFTRLRTGEGWMGGYTGAAAYLARQDPIDPTRWTSVTPPTNCGAVVVGLSDDADGGLLVACDGLVITNDDVIQRPSLAYEGAIDYLSSNGTYVAAAGRGGAFTVRAAGSWSTPVESDQRAIGRAAAFGGSVYAAGAGGLLLQRAGDGGWRYPFSRDLGLGDSELQSVAVSDAGLFIVTDSTVWRRTGGSWTNDRVLPTKGAALTAIESEVWAAVSSGEVHHRAPSGSWNVELRDAGTLRAMWGASPSRLFVVGDHAAFSRNADGGWSRDTMTGGADDLLAVSSWDGSEVWAVGASGALFQRSGTSWSGVTVSNTGCELATSAIAVASNGDVYVAGGPQLCVRRSGGNVLQPLVLPSSHDHYALQVADGALYVLGDVSSVLRLPLP